MWVSQVYMDADVFWRTSHMMKVPICLLMWVSECKVSSLGDVCGLWGYDLKWSYIQTGNSLSLVVSGMNLMFPGKQVLWYVWVFPGCEFSAVSEDVSQPSVIYIPDFSPGSLTATHLLWFKYEIFHIGSCTKPLVSSWYQYLGGVLGERWKLGSWILAGVSRSLRAWL